MMNTYRLLLERLRNTSINVLPRNVRNSNTLMALRPASRQITNTYRAPLSGYLSYKMDEYGRWLKLNQSVDPTKLNLPLPKPQLINNIAPLAKTREFDNVVSSFNSVHELGLFARPNYQNAPRMHTEPPHFGHPMSTITPAPPRSEIGPKVELEQPMPSSEQFRPS
jgi:hypothetical protein